MNKKTNVIRMLSALLIIIFALNLFACNKNGKNTEYDESQRLEITEKEVEYSESFTAEAGEAFADAAILLAEKYLEIKFSDTQKEKEKTSLKDKFSTTLIPVFKRIKIYDGEITAITDEVSRLAAEDSSAEGLSLITDLYDRFVKCIGSRRGGMLTYELTRIEIDSRRQTALKRYEQYGYAMLLAEAERYEQLYADVISLGEEKFINALTITSFVNATVRNIDSDITESAFNLSDAELLMILDTQSKLFTSLCPTDAEWQIIGKVISEFIPDSPTDLHSSVLYALKNDGYFEKAMAVMPEVFDLYASVISSLRLDGGFSLGASDEEKERAIITALSKSETALRNLDVVLSVYASTDSERLRKAVTTHADADDLLSFIEKHCPINCDTLIERLNEAKDSETVSLSANELLASYLSSLSPYLAYALFN